MSAHLPEVLFVCVQNAGRSQMAAALLDHHAAGRVRVRSAGSTPGDEINPAVLEAMREIGLDLSREFPKPLTTDAVHRADVVITMGCGDACPVYPGKRYLDWQLPDPAGLSVEQVRPIRDEIDARVRNLLIGLDLPQARSSRRDTAEVTEHRQVGDRQSIHDELEKVRADLSALVRTASPAELRRRTNGTRWSNQQMLWHMVFGYVIVRRLLPLVRLSGRLPDGFSRTFAAGLNSGTRPFHVINYLGSCGGALVFHGPRLTRQFDRTLDFLHRRLEAESDEALRRRMHFPVGWDPFFRDMMSLAEVYRYGTQHYDFHRTQLTLGSGPAQSPPRLRTV